MQRPEYRPSALPCGVAIEVFPEGPRAAIGKRRDRHERVMYDDLFSDLRQPASRWQVTP